MSRIGRMPITIPAGVELNLDDDNHVQVKGPRGQLSRSFHPRVIFEREGDTIHVKRQSEAKMDKSLHGLSRTLLNNMVVGVTDGFEKQLEIVWGGHRAQLEGQTLTLQLG
ncbi:MAG: hypothetical protein ETSY2_54550, partial [Candidatus Entotheonella gemina]